MKKDLWTQIFCVLTFLFVSWQVSQLNFDIALNNKKAADLALAMFLAEPVGFLPLGLQLLSIIALFCVFSWIVYLFATSGQHTPASLVITWTAATWLLLDQNSRQFPRSSWTWLLEPLISQPAAIFVSILSWLWLAWRTALCIRSGTPYLIRHKIAVGTAIFMGIFLSVITQKIIIGSTSENRTHLSEHPNLILIGLDSLRRDVVLSSSENELPALTKFRKKAFVQTNVVSPLARTFPAWTTLLTGKDPTETGIRDNLTHQGQIPSMSLAWKLKKLGYRTIFATDESRFSNIGKEFGFDEVIAPKTGIADFVLGQYGDHPLINLFIQIPLSEWLLPSLVNNRAFAHAYNPRHFIRRIYDKIDSTENQPLFLAVHLCLAHWPYFSAQSQLSSGRSEYTLAAAELDGQLSDLLTAISDSGYRSDSTAISIFSDHGEGLPEFRKNNLKPGTDSEKSIEVPTFGHGSTLLDPSQWQVFVMSSGKAAFGDIPTGESDQLVSLTDLSYMLRQFSGEELSPPIELETVAATRNFEYLKPRARDYVRIETGLALTNFNAQTADGDAALRIAASTYTLLPDGRLEMRTEAYRNALKFKEFGITDGANVIASIVRGDRRVVASYEASTDRIEFIDDISRITLNSPLLEAACNNIDELSHFCRKSANSIGDRPPRPHH